MDVDTGAFRALTDEVTAMREQLREFAGRDYTIEAVFKYGMETARDLATPALVPRHAGRHARPRAERPAWLRGVVDGGVR